jgi:hypothetical protein
MDVVDFYPGIQEILCPTTKRRNKTNEMPTTKTKKRFFARKRNNGPIG